MLNRKELQLELDKKGNEIQELQEQVKRLREKQRSSQSGGWLWLSCKNCTDKEKEIERLKQTLLFKTQNAEKLSQTLNTYSRRRQGDHCHTRSPEAMMEEAETFFSHRYRDYAAKLGERKFPQQEKGLSLNSREYLCMLFQKVYDCSWENMLKEIGAKIFQCGNQEVPPDRHSLFLEGYSLLISACDLTNTIPENVKGAIAETVKEDIQIQNENILIEFISDILPITWGMVIACLPIICTCKPSECDQDEQGEPGSELVCFQPALHRCFDPNPKQKASFYPRVVNTEGSLKAGKNEIKPEEDQPKRMNASFFPQTASQSHEHTQEHHEGQEQFSSISYGRRDILETQRPGRERQQQQKKEQEYRACFKENSSSLSSDSSSSSSFSSSSSNTEDTLHHEQCSEMQGQWEKQQQQHKQPYRDMHGDSLKTQMLQKQHQESQHERSKQLQQQEEEEREKQQKYIDLELKTVRINCRTTRLANCLKVTLPEIPRLTASTVMSILRKARPQFNDKKLLCVLALALDKEWDSKSRDQIDDLLKRLGCRRKRSKCYLTHL